VGFVIKCFNKERFNLELFENISKEAEMLLNKFYEFYEKLNDDSDRDVPKVCLGLISGAMIYILSIKDLNIDNIL
jgi:hypothetical protein